MTINGPKNFLNYTSYQVTSYVKNFLYRYFNSVLSAGNEGFLKASSFLKQNGNLNGNIDGAIRDMVSSIVVQLTSDNKYLIVINDTPSTHLKNMGTEQLARLITYGNLSLKPNSVIIDGCKYAMSEL